VPALREAVKSWRAADYPGITDTTRVLLKHWFYNDHKLRTGAPFKYHASQQEAIETLIYIWEAESVRSRKALLEKYAREWKDIRLPAYDEFARYCVAILQRGAGTGRDCKGLCQDIPAAGAERDRAGEAEDGFC